MQKLEQRLGIDIEEYLAAAYRSKSQAQIGEELGLDGSTINRWMRALDIEARYPGQKPPAEGAVA